MSSFVGKWKKTGSSNVDAFIKAAGCSGDVEAKIRAVFEGADVAEEFSVDGAKFHRKTIVNGQVKADITGESGKEAERDTFWGKGMVKVNVESDNKVILDQITPHPSQAVLTVTGNNLKLAWTMNGVTATREYVRA